MNRLVAIYFAAGLIAGLATVAVGARFPAILAVGTAPIFGGVMVTCLLADVWIGLAAAIVIASFGTEIGGRILSGSWSNKMLCCFLMAGLSAAAVAYSCSLAVRSYWSVFGTFIPLVEGAFASLLCYQLLRSRRRTQEL